MTKKYINRMGSRQQAAKDESLELRSDLQSVHSCDLRSIHLLLRKDVYPYNYMGEWSKFDKTELPPITSFYNNLTESKKSEKYYKHAKNVWNKFNCKELGDYHNLYLKTYVLLLVDVFEILEKLA